MMKNIAKIMTFKLSVLTTLMLCVTANNYASDIEIYKAPSLADGNAKIMFVLDVSTYMYQNPQNSGGSGGGSSGIESAAPIPADFGLPQNCTVGTEIRHSGTTYSYTASYCETAISGANTAVQLGCVTSIQNPTASPAIPANVYRCYDRLSSLKKALFEVIDDPSYSAEAAAADATGRTPKISLGFSFYPTITAFGAPMQPRLLDAAGRLALKERLSSNELPLPETNSGGKDAQVAQAYGRGVQSLIAAANAETSQERQCSGYGVYMVSGRNPEADELAGTGGAYSLLTNSLNAETKAQNPLSRLCNLTTSSTTNGVSWKCVEEAARLFYSNKSSLNQPIRTAVVSMGKGIELGKSFAFYDVDSRTDFKTYENLASDGTKVRTSLSEIDQRWADITKANVIPNNSDGLLNDRRYAMRTGIAGDGGYFAVSNITALKQSIKDFIAKTLEVNIPYITTGAPTIPQDPLNPSLVQSDAYYSQFKPTPKAVAQDASRLWVGNMKKYHVDNLGRLIGKNNNSALDSLGQLEEGVHDFWAPPVSTNSVTAAGIESLKGSELYARKGGVWSQLPLTSIVSDSTVVDRKLLTNRDVSSSGVASEKTTLSRIDMSYSANDPKRSDIMQLLSLRQVGAVMHSSPLLLSNEGKMTYNSTTGKMESTNREDYVLFGSTQGILHVVKVPDYSETTTDGVTSNNSGGREVFAFVPHEMIERQSKAFLTPELTTGGTANLFYGIDAPWTAYTEYVPKSDGTLTVGTGKTITVDESSSQLQGKQLVYGGLRMGGRSYYALDLKDMNDPKLKFHINPDAATSGSPLSYMGQSWSKPKIAWVNWNGVRKLVMFVGGGYDAGYESDTYNQVNGVGAGVYMFSADGEDAGSLLWWASSNASQTSDSDETEDVIALRDENLKYSVVSEIKTADRDNDGLVDHLYFGDLGGQVFRIDLNNNASTIGAFATRSTRILNMHNTTAGYSPRFYAAPSFAIFKDTVSGKLFAAISIGSGNLSHPLAGYDSGRSYDALYTIYDKDVTKSNLYSSSVSLDTHDVSVGNSTAALALNEITLANRFQQTAEQMVAPIAPYASSSGWYYQLIGGSKIQNEKIFYTPSVIDYDLYVSSYDSSRLGLTGACGGGVQGVSKVQLFCMPFGQCSAADYPDRTDQNYSDEHGPGIQNHAIASGGDGTTRLVGGAIIGNNLDDQYKTKIKLIAQRWYEK
jgi:type IV pilus assembly protein PilY1